MRKSSPVVPSKSQTKANYDRLSSVYDWIAGPSEKKFKDFGLKIFDAQLGEVLLEIGYGTGYCLIELAKAVGEEGKIFGIELSEKMQSVSEKKLKKKNLSKRVKLRLGDAVNLPYEDESFDGIFMSFVLELFVATEIPKVLAECKRVLKPGGRLCVVSLSRIGYPSIPIRIYEWAQKKWPVLIDCRPINGKEVLALAGFELNDYQMKKMWGLPVEIILANNTTK